MKRGKTEVETLHQLNGWGIRDILEGTESSGYRTSTDQLLITAIGETLFLCKSRQKGSEEWREERGGWSLAYREWERI